MSPPWMPFYPADYLGGTMNFTTEEHGAYLLLIIHYWQTGGVPTDDAELATIARLPVKRWLAVRSKIAKKFTSDWRHERIDHELAKSEAKHNKRAEAGKRGGEAKAARKQTASNATAKPCHSSQPDSSVADATGAVAPPDPSLAERELFSRGREVLGKNAGGMVAALKHAKGGNVALARAAIEQASQTDSPADYIGRIINGPKQHHKHPIASAFDHVDERLAAMGIG